MTYQFSAIQDLAANRKSALATGPFGSSIGSKTFQNQGVPVIRGSNLSEAVELRLNDDGLVFIDASLAEKFSRSKAVRGDLIFTCWGTVNQVGLIDERSEYDAYIVSNKQMKLSADPEKADPLYLYYYFSSPLGQQAIADNTIGSSVPGFNLTALRSIRVPSPPLKVQIGISQFLGSLDDKIELNRRMNQTLEEMARALFRDWFVDFGPTRRQMEGATDPTAIMGHAFPSDKAATLATLFPVKLGEGELPEGWAVQTLADRYKITIGRTPPRKEKWHFRNDGHGVPWLSIRDLGNCETFAFDTAETLEENSVASCRVPVIGAGTVMVSFKLTVGRVAIAAKDMATNEAIAHLNTTDKSAPTEYTYSWMKEFDYGTLGSTSSIANAVNSKTIRSMPILSSGIALEAKYSEVVKYLFAKIKANTEENQTLAELRDLLLPKLISGQIRLKNVENMV